MTDTPSGATDRSERFLPGGTYSGAAADEFAAAVRRWRESGYDPALAPGAAIEGHV